MSSLSFAAIVLLLCLSACVVRGEAAAPPQWTSARVQRAFNEIVRHPEQAIDSIVRDVAQARRDFVGLATEDLCSTAAVWNFTNLSTSCSVPLAKISAVDYTDPASVEAGTAACVAPCVLELVDLFAALANAEKKCVLPVAATAVFLPAYCARSSVDGELCAAVNTRTLDCSSVYSRSPCEKRSHCVWHDSNSSCGYIWGVYAPSVSAMQVSCASGCSERHADGFAQLEATGVLSAAWRTAETMRRTARSNCATFEGTYCRGIQKKYDARIGDTSRKSDEQRPPYCQNRTEYGCLQITVPYQTQLYVWTYRFILATCMGALGTSDITGVQMTEELKAGCMWLFSPFLSVALRQTEQFEYDCATHDGSNQGKACRSWVYNVTERYGSPQYESIPCWYGITQTCSTDCDAQMQKRLTTLGCCSYYYIMDAARPLPDDSLVADFGVENLTFVGSNWTTVTTTDTYLQYCTESSSLVRRCWSQEVGLSNATTVVAVTTLTATTVRSTTATTAAIEAPPGTTSRVNRTSSLTSSTAPTATLPFAEESSAPASLVATGTVVVIALMMWNLGA